MKSLMSLAIVLLMSVSLSAQSYCLQLTEMSNDGQYMTVKIEMQGDEAFRLGTSNLQFQFPNEVVGAPVLESSIMQPPTYFIPTVTLPFEDQCSFNIELAFPETGMDIAASPNWTELGLIRFAVLDPTQSVNLSWSYNGGTTETVAFLDDEATQFFASSPDCLMADQVSGIEDNGPIQSFSLYPNPSNGDQIRVAYNLQESADVVYSIYDVMGKLIMENTIDASIGEQNELIELNGLSAGQYSLTIRANDFVKTERFDIVK